VNTAENPGGDSVGQNASLMAFLLTSSKKNALNILKN